MPVVADPVQLIIVTGAAGALFWVLKLIVDGKLHTSSEVDGLKADKKMLLEINQSLSEALDQANERLSKIIEMLKERPSGSP